MTTTPRPQSSARATRRAVLATAGWATPVALLGSAAPAMAASRPCTWDLGAPSAANGWTTQTSPANGLRSSPGENRFANNGYHLSVDPAVTTVVRQEVRSPQVTFELGNEYHFSFDYTKFGGNPRLMILDFYVNGQRLGTRVNSDSSPNSGVVTAVYRPTATVTSSVYFDFVIGTARNSFTADDIYVSNFTSYCEPIPAA